ncbi:MAG TPA: sigma-70 family RNA polymerase sigma factor [Candidatus Paceibacterota bacterium]|jgi:RNA polymerase sigma factor, sigma-70 family
MNGFLSEKTVTAAERDAVLVDRFKKGDESAFEEIYRNYRPYLTNVAFTIIRNHADAEEIAQDALRNAYRKLPDFRGDCALSSWLYRICQNISKNRYLYNWRRGRGRSVSTDAPLQNAADGNLHFGDLLAEIDHGPDRKAEDYELAAIIRACMKKLTHEQQVILHYKLIHRSYEDIAKKLKIECGTVKSRLSRTREHLHKIIVEEYGGEFGIPIDEATLQAIVGPLARDHSVVGRAVY